MALTYSSQKELGRVAPDFSLKGVDGRTYSLADFKSSRALVVGFLCNHCPYVIAIQDRFVALAREFQAKGVGFIAINSNDTVQYPDDSFEKMKIRAAEKVYSFPYVLDETQDVARAYDAACTPDLYAFENKGGEFLLRYHGRLDDNWKEPTQVRKRELADALTALVSGAPVNPDQLPSMGCNIKWKGGYKK